MRFSIKNTLTFHLLLVSSSLFIVGMEERPQGIHEIVERMLNDDSMPMTLYRNLHQRQLHPTCAVIDAVANNDFDSIEWMVKKWPLPEGKNFLTHFSIIPSECYDEYVTPLTIANVIAYNKTADAPKQRYRGIDGEDMYPAKIECKVDRETIPLLVPIAQPTHTVTEVRNVDLENDPITFLYSEVVLRGLNLVVPVSMRLGQRMFVIDGPEGRAVLYAHGKYDKLYMAACSKDLVQHAQTLQTLKISAELPEKGMVKRLAVAQCLLLIIIMNNDVTGLDLIKKLICGNDDFELNRLLGMTFYNAIGSGQHKVSFESDEEIQQLINYPILQSRHQFLYGMLELYTQVGDQEGHNVSANTQVRKAKELLDNAMLDAAMEEMSEMDLK